MKQGKRPSVVESYSGLIWTLRNFTTPPGPLQRDGPAGKLCVLEFDQRPEPAYGTGAITNFAKIEAMPKAGGKWNTYEITAKGPRLTVVLNGVRTVEGMSGARIFKRPKAKRITA